MTGPQETPPLPWRRRSRGLDGPDDRMSELFRRLPDPASVAPEMVDRVMDRVLRRRSWSALRGRLPLRLAELAAALAAMAGLAFALVRWPTSHPLPLESAPLPAATEPLWCPAPATTLENPPPLAGWTQKTDRKTIPSVHPRRLSQPLPFRPTPPAVIPPTPLTPSSVASELPLLNRALRQFRIEAQPEMALSTLQEYRRAFPHGTLGAEAGLAEVEIDLTLGRSDSALKLLDAFHTQGLTTAPRGVELRLLRAELAAKRGRCAEMVPELDAILNSAAPTPLRERAIQALISCHAPPSRRILPAKNF